MTGADIDFYQSDSESRQDQEEEEEEKKKEDPLHPLNIIAIREDLKFYTKNLKSSTEHLTLARNELFRLNYLQEFFINKIIANKDNDQEIYLQINKINSFYVSHIQKKNWFSN